MAVRVRAGAAVGGPGVPMAGPSELAAAARHAQDLLRTQGIQPNAMMTILCAAGVERDSRLRFGRVVGM